MTALLKKLAELVGIKALDRLAEAIIDKMEELLRRLRDWLANSREPQAAV